MTDRDRALKPNMGLYVATSLSVKNRPPIRSFDEYEWKIEPRKKGVLSRHDMNGKKGLQTPVAQLVN